MGFGVAGWTPFCHGALWHGVLAAGQPWAAYSWPPSRRGSSGGGTSRSGTCLPHNPKAPNAAGTLRASRRLPR
jgi:hypothetical protein